MKVKRKKDESNEEIIRRFKNKVNRSKLIKRVRERRYRLKKKKV